ncbi:hypothetical protein PNP83_09475 [Halobacterium salinarum]|nr:hypothetical protein [Halobacterium salinarum]
MSEPTDRFVIEIGSGTVVHIIDMDADQDESNSRFSFGIGGPGEMMCSHGNRHPRPRHVPVLEFLADNDIDKDGFEGDAPDERSRIAGRTRGRQSGTNRTKPTMS